MIQIELEAEPDRDKYKALLRETYVDFKALLQLKLLQLAAAGGDALFRTREYHALLAFGICFRRLNCPMDEEIAVEFGLGSLAETYLKHVAVLTVRPDSRVIPDSPYFSQGEIFMVG